LGFGRFNDHEHIPIVVLTETFDWLSASGLEENMSEELHAGMLTRLSIGIATTSIVLSKLGLSWFKTNSSAWLINCSFTKLFSSAAVILVNKQVIIAIILTNA
jgi:hypothetical protein